MSRGEYGIPTTLSERAFGSLFGNPFEYPFHFQSGSGVVNQTRERLEHGFLCEYGVRHPLLFGDSHGHCHSLGISFCENALSTSELGSTLTFYHMNTCVHQPFHLFEDENEVLEFISNLKNSQV